MAGRKRQATMPPEVAEAERQHNRSRSSRRWDEALHKYSQSEGEMPWQLTAQDRTLRGPPRSVIHDQSVETNSSDRFGTP